LRQDRWASWAKHQKPSTNRPPGRPPKRWRESCTSTSEEDRYRQTTGPSPKRKEEEEEFELFAKYAYII
jgi:hypothetical protein